MRPFELAAAGNANSGNDNSVGKNAMYVGGLQAVLAVCRRLWPMKTAQELAHRTGVSQRSAERWLAGQADISLEAAQRLLRSEHGFEFLHALMAGSTQPWWWRVEHAHKVGGVRRQLKATAKKLAELREEQEQLDV